MPGMIKLLLISLLLTMAAACMKREAGQDMNTDHEDVTYKGNVAPPADINNALATNAGRGLPEFNLPAPRASAHMVLPRSFLPAGVPTLKQVDDELSSRLAAAGYEDLGYYRVPNGFAIATGMERVQPDGHPFAGAQRWDTNAAGLNKLADFSLAGLVSSLVNADPGSYRVMVFVVTNQPVISSGPAMESGTATNLSGGGSTSLPADFAKARFTAPYNATVLIYEFKRTSVGKPAKFSSPSTRTAADQLRLAGIMKG